MRNSLVAAIVASIVGFSANSAAQAAIRRATAIPPQQLTTALRALIDDRELQIVYSSDLLGERRSAGANGELTLDEALTQILSGTGLVYTYLDASTVTILPKQPTASAVTVPSGVSRQERRNWRLASSEAPAPTTQGASGEPAATATSEDGTELYEVIVTAQKRAQKLIDVPISISAVDADTLEALRVEQVGDYIFSIPNATFIDQGAFYGQRVTFRGISDFAGGRFDVTSVLLDDIGFSAMNSAVVLSTGLLDIERIEVLRGPQGTLSGRNSLGGSINIVTAKPQMDAIKGSMTVDVGRFGTQYFKGILNVPLSERVAVRTAAFQSSSDGAMRNVGPAGGSSGTDMFGGRAAVRFLATDKLTIDAAFGYESRKRDFDDLVGHNFNLGAVESVNDNWVNDKLPILESWGGSYPGEISLFNQVGNNGGTVSRDVAEYANIEDWTVSLRASYELDRHTIELLYGHFDYELRFMEDYDQTEYAWWKGYDGVFSQTDSLELRFASDYSGPFNWVAGISQLRESLDSESTDFIGMWAILGGTPRYAGGDGGYRAAYYEQNVNDFRSFGVYANVFWDISPRLHLSAGVRYSRETSDAGGNFIYDETDPNLVLPALTPGDYAANPTLEEFSPRIAFNYDVSKASSVYVQYSTGYRAGYGNSPLSISANAPEAVDPESLRNYEIGFKGRLLDNRLSFSTAVFYMDYTDLQIQAPVSSELNPFPFTIYYDTNAGKAHSQGIEFEAQFQATRQLRLETAVGYVKAIIDDLTLVDTGTEIASDYAGLRIPNARPWTASASAIYSRPMGESVATFRLDHRYQDSVQQSRILPDPNFQLPSFQTTDLSIALMRDRWDLTAYIENLFDEAYFTSVSSTSICCGYRGRMVNAPPRMFGMRLNYRFAD